ncbi:Abi family protein [Zafaria sp. Z1313]|uniref:Abi family protein n=1 Tax=unclassified Zafaria TaxID=2828765 RepID=UPI002E769AD8|nr:Abi family protein [Zafaria sp. J156]MEE1621430.1 Abi family protein [Zafaria sp. J156]
MAEYTKQWLSVEDQVAKLASRGVGIPEGSSGAQLPRQVGYYRLTGYLYPFRASETYVDDDGRARVRVLNHYRPGTSIGDAAALIDFERRLRMLILEGIERIEVSLRMQIGYVLGRRSAFAHLEPGTFVAAFTDPQMDPETGASLPSRHEQWTTRIASLNYVRNVAAHHARIFNRKLVTAPKRPGKGQVPLLDHLRDEESSKQVFGLYNVLAVMAYLLRTIDPNSAWAGRVVELIGSFPRVGYVTPRSIGVPDDWTSLGLWQP